jgi:RHS repeat-associated protein
MNKPFGEQIPLMTTKTRKTYIGKERDEESYLGDFGVRKYDYAAGRFTSPDVLWEKYIGWSPYHYCMNNPISASDPSGLDMNIYYRAPNFFSFDPGHISFEVIDDNGKRLGSWSFTPKNISKNNFPQIFSRTPSRQADINWDKGHKDKELLIKTNDAFDKILVKKINDKIKENLDYGLPYRNCATTTNELIQDALNEYGSDVKINSVYQLRLTPQTSFENLKDKKTIIEKNLNKGE